MAYSPSLWLVADFTDKKYFVNPSTAPTSSWCDLGFLQDCIRRPVPEKFLVTFRSYRYTPWGLQAKGWEPGFPGNIFMITNYVIKNISRKSTMVSPKYGSFVGWKPWLKDISPWEIHARSQIPVKDCHQRWGSGGSGDYGFLHDGK